MSHRKNGPNSNFWTPSFHPQAINDEWWGWSLLDLLADLPEILVQYLFIKIRRQVVAFQQLCSRRQDSDEAGRNRQAH
jgi:hypothetical protein